MVRGMRCRRMQGADRARTHRQVGLRADALEASEIDMCCDVTALIRRAALCSGITVFSSLWTTVLLHTGYRTQSKVQRCTRKFPRQANHRQVSLAWLFLRFFCDAMSMLSSCHAMSSPGGLRDLTDRSASDAHINMTYVPYLHPAAVGPFRFAGYCICMEEVAGCMAWQ